MTMHAQFAQDSRAHASAVALLFDAIVDLLTSGECRHLRGAPRLPRPL